MEESRRDAASTHRGDDTSGPPEHPDGSPRSSGDRPPESAPPSSPLSSGEESGDLSRLELEQERRRLELERRELELDRRTFEAEKEAAAQQHETVDRIAIDPNEDEAPTPVNPEGTPDEPEFIEERKRRGVRWRTERVPK